MKEVPVCLQRRYRTLDNLINGLDSLPTNAPASENCNCGCKTDSRLKLMHDFWNFLKEDPNSDLTQVVQKKVDEYKRESKSNRTWQSPCTKCYVANDLSRKLEEESSSRQKKCNCKKITDPGSTSASSAPPSVAPTCSGTIAGVTFGKNCVEQLSDLIETEDLLKDAIKKLEERERNSIELLKKADCMWVCMEEAYKKKLEETTERHKTLEKELKELHAGTKNWRTKMKDLESEVTKVEKTHQDVKEKIIQKKGDVKCIDMEIADLQKRMDGNKKELEAIKKSSINKKEASDKKIAKTYKEIKELEKKVAEENKKKQEKEAEGNKFIKEAREDLQKIHSVLLKKKLENEDLKAEKTALQSELDLLIQVQDKCKHKCDLKEKLLDKQIEKINKEIADGEMKCIKCNECTDTAELERLCFNCPRCLEERRCMVEGDHCDMDESMDCVCTAVKKKFLDNVFENMYTVLMRLITKGSGKAVADKVLDCMRKSKNGKLDERTRKALQGFILTGVKKHLNLTIVGGAVKTRCEMEPDTYKQLMYCLQKVQVKTPMKVDKAIASKKESCRRWGGTNECHCPKGPKACICMKKAPPPSHDPTPCPEDEEDNQDDDDMDTCPKKQVLNCDCGKNEKSSIEVESADNEPSKLKPEPCQGATCKHSKDTRKTSSVIRSDKTAIEKSKDAKSVAVKLAPTLKEQDYCDCALTVGTSRNNTGRTKSEDNRYSTKLAKSPSGALVIEFEEEFQKALKEKMNENCSTKIILRGTNSGRLSLSFFSDEKDLDNDKIMTLKKVLSGCFFFEGTDNLLESIKQNSIVSLENVKPYSQCNDMKPNAVLRRTTSGVVLIIATESLDSIKKILLSYEQSPGNFSKVKIQHSNDTMIEFPGVLKTTSSHNFVLAIDKEFEKNFRNTVQTTINDDIAVISTLRKSNLDTHVLKFGGQNVQSETDITILKKTRSGNIKIITNDLDEISSLVNTIRETEDKNMMKICMKMLNELLDSNIYRMSVRQNSQVPSNLFAKCLAKDDGLALDKKIKDFMEEFKDCLLHPSKFPQIQKTISVGTIVGMKDANAVNQILLKLSKSTNIFDMPNDLDNKRIKFTNTNNVTVCSEDNRENNKLIESNTFSRICNDSIGPLTRKTINRDLETRHQTVAKEINESSNVRLMTNADLTETDKLLRYILIKPTPNSDISIDEHVQEHVVNTSRKSGWDSFSFLPPQLPSFLGDFAQLYN